MAISAEYMKMAEKDITELGEYNVEEKQSMDELEWLELSRSLGPRVETFQEKLIRKTKENPFVPLGCLATTAALTYGIFCFYTGQSKKSQLMMRARVICQAATVAALVAGFLMTKRKDR